GRPPDTPWGPPVLCVLLVRAVVGGHVHRESPPCGVRRPVAGGPVDRLRAESDRSAGVVDRLSCAHRTEAYEAHRWPAVDLDDDRPVTRASTHVSEERIDVSRHQRPPSVSWMA